ncbi:MAG: NifB/NifX family molybdenum-iron cluster-binding protein [Candidatus Aminicenantes bacterium]
MKKAGMAVMLIIIFFAGTLMPFTGQGENPEKIAIASEGETIHSQVADQGPRGAWLLFFNQEGDLVEAVENPFQHERSQAGVRCAEFLAEKEVTVFVAGQAGPKMKQVLDSRNIDFMAFSGTVDDALAQALKKDAVSNLDN